ncbi:hypothetical protein PRZ48_009038 [Zasmidium cellare]|uniref:Zn(2)-C6 fungal-type domain-containing protein n=1 Tax=Zasmidium cellare TaxID=395010 RepID=A0ABR0EHY0_ZASCE|nr:hypothetical protein PRZ48_009038 [Zasmidium cellare]
MLGMKHKLTKRPQLKGLDFISSRLPATLSEDTLAMAADQGEKIVLKRTKTGCFTCRKRRKKCDETRPKCGACSRNDLRCSWPRQTNNDGRSEARICADRYSAIAGTGGTLQTKEPGKLGHDHFLVEHLFQQNDEEDLNPSIRPTLSAITSASERTPFSALVLQSYLENTSLLMVAKPAHSNAFLTMVFPVAAFDDLLMDALLAMSGHHLYGMDTSQYQVGRVAYHHYGMALRGLHHRIRGAKDLPAAAILDLILVLLLLCHAEAFSGEPYGTMFYHLRACRQLILHLLERPGETGRAGTRRLMGFALESYSFLALTANVTPYGMLESRSLPIDDPFLTSAKQLESYDTFGSFFPCGHTIYAYIPSIAMLGNQRLQEQELDSDYCSFESTKTYEDLLASISDWQPPKIGEEMKQWSAEYISTG